MNIKCKNCGGTLVFDAQLQKLVCDHCLSMFPVEETLKKHTTVFEKTDLSNSQSAKDELMDYKIYSCTNCGAELMINDVELASYCAYCGQPSIVYSRTEQRQKPRYIIPFKISKNEAIATIREKFVKSDYVSKTAKYFEPELLRGIYIPYGMFYYFVRSTVLLKGVHDRNMSTGKLSYYYQKIFSRIGHIPVDASYQFPNKSADLLEPFHGKDLVEFDPGYLSGYYADLRDEDFSQLRSRADHRADKIFHSRLTSIPFVNHVEVVREKTDIECVKEDYALLPVWFMVFEHEGEQYTIMVNGQTGKVAGTLPTSNRKLVLWFLFSFIMCALVIIPLSVLSMFTAYVYAACALICAGVPSLIYYGIKNLRKYKYRKQLSTSTKMKYYAKERQDN